MRTLRDRGSLVCAIAAAALLAVVGGSQAKPPAKPQWLVGSMHEHSAYSDGWPSSRPYDYYLSGRNHGLDFMAGSDHSDGFELPNSFSNYCLDDSNPTGIAQIGCALADPDNPPDSFRKWDATGEQAAEATTSTFTGIRGFEWTSDRFGHINVYFSQNYRGAKEDGGYVSMTTFYTWLTLPPSLGGGADGIATFNHPGDKKLSTSDPGFNWDDFAYVPSVDDQMVGIETFNSAKDFGSPFVHSGPAEGWYAHALDRGWHVGAIGAEDLGHNIGDDWGGPGQAKTVVLSQDRSAAAIKDALLARHFYAVAGPQWRLSFSVNGAGMGSRLAPAAGSRLTIKSGLTRIDGAPIDSPHLELITSGGRQVGTFDATTFTTHIPAAADEGWYFVRATAGGKVVGYSTPVWVSAA
jgi:hypothetical protein